MHDDNLDAYAARFLPSIRDQMGNINMAGVHSRVNSQMMSALSAGQNAGIQGLPADAQENLYVAAKELKVELRQLVPFNTKQVVLELNGRNIPIPSYRNAVLAEGFLRGKKGAKAAAVAKRLTDEGTFACDVSVDVRQAMNWLRATYEMETGEEL